MPDVTVTARKNGPLMVQGTITFIDREGNEQELGADGPVVLVGAAAPRTSLFATAPIGRKSSATSRPRRRRVRAQIERGGHSAAPLLFQGLEPPA